MKKYILKAGFYSDFEFTTIENHKAQISDARAVHKFNRRDGFNTFDDVLRYIEKWFNISLDEIQIVF